MEINEMKIREFILGTSLLVAAGSSYSTCSAMELRGEITGVEPAKGDLRPFYADWKINCKGTSDVSLSDGRTSTLHYFIRRYPKDTWFSNLRASCSILMNNGAQIDYEPGLAAIWLTRDPDLRDSRLLTGNFKGRDLYSYSAQEFSEILMKADSVFSACPVHVTFSDGGSFPIQHPESVRGEVIRKWFESK